MLHHITTNARLVLTPIEASFFIQWVGRPSQERSWTTLRRFFRPETRQRGTPNWPQQASRVFISQTTATKLFPSTKFVKDMDCVALMNLLGIPWYCYCSLSNVAWRASSSLYREAQFASSPRRHEYWSRTCTRSSKVFLQKKFPTIQLTCFPE